jgi:hypothetical protein
MYADTISGILYVGGEFAFADTVRVNGIGAWDGTQWLGLGGGDTTCGGACANPFISIARWNNDIYTGGFFTTIGGVPNSARGARWDGLSWNSLGTVNSQCFFKAIDNTLYCMGLYDNIGGITANAIATWDGTQWHDVHDFPPNPLGNINTISSVESYQGELYVGGSFNVQNGRKEIAKWDGMNWVDLQGGINGGMADVRCMVSFNNELYVGGWFYKADGNAGNFLMVWNGTNWREFSPDIIYGGPVFDLNIIDNQLYIAGAFNFEGDTTVFGMAKYDGTTFSAFGGANHWAYQIAGLNNNIYVLTDDVIGMDTVHHVAQWMGGSQVDSSIAVVAGINDDPVPRNFTLYPNPSANQITIEFKSTGNQNTAIEIKNVLGQTIKRIDHSFWNGINKLEINIHELPKGLYFIQVAGKSQTTSKKFIKQ